MVIRNLNQLLCITLILCCMQAYRSYLRAADTKAALKEDQQLNVMNGTDWNVVMRYSTPAGVITNDTITPDNSKVVSVKTKDPVSYSLAKEKAQTATRVVPVSAIQQGTFQITAEMIKDLIAPFVQPATPAATTAAPSSGSAPSQSTAPAQGHHAKGNS